MFADDVAAQYFNVTTSEGHEGCSLQQMLKAIHPEDHPAVDSSIRNALSGTPFRIKCRVLSQRLGERIVLANGRCFLDEYGKPSYCPGFVMDISDTAGSTIERLSGHLAAALDLARGLDGDALLYLLEAAKHEVGNLRRTKGREMN